MNRMNLLLVAAVIAVVWLQPARAEQSPQITIDANNIWMHVGKSPVLQYRYGDVPFKPYVKELYTPDGLNVLLDAPADHLHHHGLMFAVAVDGLNFWEEAPTAGHQGRGSSPLTSIARHGGGPSAGFMVGIPWVDSTGAKRVLSEMRTIEVCGLDKLGATAVAWDSNLGIGKGQQSVTLSGSHYFGLGMRFVHAMDAGEFFNADGKEGTIFRGEERLVRSDWCAYTAAIDGKPVTVAMFGCPANPRGQTVWFTMAKPFAYLSATLNLHEEPLVVSSGKPISLRYAVVAWDGRVDATKVGSAYRWFVDEYWRSSTSVEGVDFNDTSK